VKQIWKKEKKVESRSKKERKIKTDCLVYFSTFEGNGVCHRQWGKEEGRKLLGSSGFLAAVCEPHASSGVEHENHAPPLFLHLPEAFLAVFLDF
jgi:hypothetical protein